MALYHFGVADIKSFYDKWVTNPTYSFLEKVFMTATDIAPFTSGPLTEEEAPTVAHLAWYGHYLANKDSGIDRSVVRVGSWVDLMGKYLPQKFIMSKEDARKALIAAVQHLVNEEFLPTITDLAPATTNITSCTPLRAGHVAEANGEYVFKLSDAYQVTDPMTAMTILRMIAQHTFKNFKVDSLTMIVHVYLSILKRGIIRNQFVNKVTRGLVDDLGITNIKIIPEDCERFSKVFSPYIDDVVAAEIVTHLASILPTNALRLKLTIEDAAGTGLTALVVCGRALRLFTDFKWNLVEAMYRDEWANLLAAVKAVGTNVWYGFKSDLGPARSTKFRNISYVAKELLIKVNGEDSLSRYPGWTRKPKLQSAADKLVAEYKTHRNMVETHQESSYEIMPRSEAVEEVYTVVLTSDVYSK